MAKSRVVHMRTNEDLVKDVLEVAGSNNITAVTEMAWREFIMAHKPRHEVLKEEIEIYKSRIALCEEELKELTGNKTESKAKEIPVAEKSLSERLEVWWEKILVELNEDSLDWCLGYPPFLMKWERILKPMNQAELKDIIRERYNRKR